MLQRRGVPSRIPGEAGVPGWALLAVLGVQASRGRHRSEDPLVLRVRRGPVGGEVQPVFGAGRDDEVGTGHASLPEPLMFCRSCAERIRERRANASSLTSEIDALELWALLPTRDPDAPRPDDLAA